MPPKTRTSLRRLWSVAGRAGNHLGVGGFDRRWTRTSSGASCLKGQTGIVVPSSHATPPPVLKSPSMAIPAFLSYAHQDRKLAGLAKSFLDYYGGFDTFLAHESLKPSEEWQKTILSKLKHCTVFLPLLTDAFKNSDWTDQETGVAVASKKIIVPLKVTMNPYGFINRYQAQSFHGAAVGGSLFPPVIREACWNIVKTLSSNKKVARPIRDGMIEAFGNSGSFNESASNATKLESLEPFSDQQLNEVVRVSCDNSQIFSGFDARRYVRDLIRRNKSRVDSKQMREFLELSKPG
jgi:hypothetical protein